MGDREFKQAEIGRIPKEWEVVRLKESKEMDLIMGQSPPGKSYNKKGEGLPFIQGKAEFGSMCPSPILWTTQPTKIAEEGDILISVRAPVGDVNMCPYRLCIGRGLAAIRIKGFSNIFYFYWFQKEKRRIEGIGKGSTFRAITKDELSNLRIPIPPLPEQKKIAEILGAVDEAIEKVDESIAKTERLKKGLMQELLTKGIGHKEVKDTEIGRIPKEWEVVRLGEVCAQKKEIVLPKGDGRTNFIGLEHLESGKIKVKSFSTDLGIKSSKFKFCRGDILYGKLRPYLDKVVIAEIKGVCSTDLIVLSPDEGKCVKEFLIYVLHSKMFIRHAISNTSGTNHPRTSWKAISEFEFGLPPLFEQKKIAEILSTVDKRLELLRNKKEKLVRVKKGLMNDLLTGKKRVRV